MGAVDVVLKRRDKPGAAGYRYEVWRNGELLTTSRDPEYAACRALLAQGLRGTVRFWREGRAEHNCSMDIERGAKFCATEGQKQGIHVGKYSEVRWRQGDNGELAEAA